MVVKRYRPRTLMQSSINDAIAEVFQNNTRDGREIELSSLFQSPPLEVQEFSIAVFDGVRDRICVHTEEARVKAPGTSRRRDCTCKKVKL